MSVNSNKSRLVAVTRELSAKWDATREHWQDAKAAEFDRKYIEELVVNVDSATEVMDQLDKILAKIRSDCE